MASVETYTFLVRGRVQGVGYRLATVRRAHLLGITGWVRNLDDGTVEGMIQGPPDQIDLMLSWLRRGPPGARVDSLDCAQQYEARRHGHFEQR